MKKLNRNQIKYLVVLAMVLDHIGWAFFPVGSLEGQLLHFVGRLTGPTMAFFLEEGYEHPIDVLLHLGEEFFGIQSKNFAE